MKDGTERLTQKPAELTGGLVSEPEDEKREILLEFLEVLDHFESAFLHIGKGPDAVIQELETVRMKLTEVLELNGVVPFDSEGQRFDPATHEAIGEIQAGGNEAGIVFAESRRGYVLNGELLRPARVFVLG